MELVDILVFEASLWKFEFPLGAPIINRDQSQ
jgi:hypothetical protein